MKKNVISAIAAMAVLTSGAFAFESLTTGEIVTSKTEGVSGDWIPMGPTASEVNLHAKEPNYDKAKYTFTTTNKQSAGALVESGTRGDALIYPAFSQKAGFQTEIVVRNTYSDRAVVAKVVLYSADATRELIDFNIYLSRDDVFRFTIKDGLVTTKDGSIIRAVSWPQDKTQLKKEDSMTPNESGKEAVINPKDSKGKTILVSDAQGYVVVYAMAQAQNKCVSSGATSSMDTIPATSNVCVATNTTNNTLGYHNAHSKLAKDYRYVLDVKRGGVSWRNAFKKGGFKNGMMTGAVPAPNVTEFKGAYSTANKLNDFSFTDPANDILTGTVKIDRVTKGYETEMILPATALSNYTNDNLMMWTEGEYAAIQDRNIKGDASGKAIYDKNAIKIDAQKFVKKAGYYTFEADTANRILFTQPFKRILVQLNEDAYATPIYWEKDTWKYGGFKTTSVMFDEEENSYESPEGTTIITSPITSFGSSALLTPELAVLKDEDLQFQNDEMKKFFKGKNGFGNIEFGTNGIPAIITQMVGATVNGKAQMNWIYTPMKD